MFSLRQVVFSKQAITLATTSAVVATCCGLYLNQKSFTVFSAKDDAPLDPKEFRPFKLQKIEDISPYVSHVRKIQTKN